MKRIITVENNKVKEFVTYATIGGIILGLLIPFVVIATELYHKGGFTYGNFISLHENRPVIIFLECLIIVIPYLTYMLASKYSNDVEVLVEKIELEKTKSDKILEFTNKLRSGDINAEYVLFDKGDIIGKSLINLRDEFKRSREEEETRRNEDDQRHWATEGIAIFSEILRQHNNNLEQLTYKVISKLVKYMEAIQGGFFITEHDEENDKVFFKLYASYAYDRKKFSNKKIEWGESLVGASALEKETIYMEKVSENYVKVTSGLGKANPKSILIVPLKINDEVYGVIELASFKKIDQYKRDFMEKLAESIASTISSFKINDRTQKLLLESQIRGEKMKEQEELLRKNLQELQVTQREAAQQSEEFISFTNSVNHTLIRAEYSVDGTLTYANTKFIQKLGYRGNADVEGKHILMFINKKDHDWFNGIWKKLSEGGKHFENYMKHVTKEGRDLWTMATYTCVRNNEGGVEKILFLAIDTTEEKKQSLDYESQIDALNRSSIKVEFTPAGNFVSCNANFSSALDFVRVAIDNYTIFDLLPKDKVGGFKVLWEKIIAGSPFEGELVFKSSKGEDVWFNGILMAVSDMYGDIAKVIYICNNVTEQKQMQLQNAIQTEQLKKQELKLQQSELDLSKKLRQTRSEMENQFKKIELVKMLNEKTLEGMLDAIVSINKDGVIEFFNRAAEELWGWDKNDVIGQNITIILPEKYQSEGDDYLGHYFRPGVGQMISTRTEVFVFNKNSERISVLLTLSEAQIGREYRLTAFIQNIEVELF